MSPRTPVVPPVLDVDTVLDSAKILVCTGSGGVHQVTTAMQTRASAPVTTNRPCRPT